MFKDLYKVLNVSLTASQIEIKKSYRKLALKYHPDITFGDKIAEEKFKEIQNAYEILSNEEQKKSYDIKYKSFFNIGNNSTEQKSNESKKQNNNGDNNYVITPSIILTKFKNFEKSLYPHQKNSILQSALLENLKSLLNENYIQILRMYDDLEINRQIISSALTCCKKLNYQYQQTIINLLVKVGGTDNLILKDIFEFSRKQKYNNYATNAYTYGSKNYKTIIVCGLILFAIVSSIFSKQDNNNEQINRPSSGDLYKDSTKSTNIVPVKDSVNQQNLSGWDTTDYSTGNSPGCYNFTPKYSLSMDNKLEVSVGQNTDAVIKLINIKTEKCIRYAYIRSGDTYDVKHIPQGRYYLKIAYGKDWRQKIENGVCIGKFILNSLYKKGDDILDFNKIYKEDQIVDGRRYRNYSIPSYSLRLDVIATDTAAHFQTNDISEDEFNN